ELNIWEAVWCGSQEVAAVASQGAGEADWYRAGLYRIDLRTGHARGLYQPRDQLGWPAACAAGRHLAVVEALCSDRLMVAGDLRLIETASGKVQHVDTRGLHVSYLDCRSSERLLLAGQLALQTVVGIYDLRSRALTALWNSSEFTSGGRYATIAGRCDSGDFVLVGESFLTAPAIATVRNGEYRQLRSFDLGYAGEAQAIESVEQVSWSASDGLHIQGWLLTPRAQRPHPLVMELHGGPVWHWRPRWLGRSGLHTLMLLKRGYAVFLPNPRGSDGRGQDFARQVVGELGGADGRDCLSGLDALIERGIADPARLGVTGVSYGGYMTAWLIGQDTRFAAAVPVAPITNYLTAQLISNISHFVNVFLADTYTRPDSKYFHRSPVFHAHKVRTPTLGICGALDRCTPPEEAVQFHNALVENGVESVLVTYPQEGHGIRKLPAALDYAARLVGWFESHMPPVPPTL